MRPTVGIMPGVSCSLRSIDYLHFMHSHDGRTGARMETFRRLDANRREQSSVVTERAAARPDALQRLIDLQENLLADVGELEPWRGPAAGRRGKTGSGLS